MGTAAITPFRLDRDALLARYDRARERSNLLFDLIESDAYYGRPISLRHPIVFYEGHFVAFAVNTLLKKALGRPGVDEQLEQLFARGIDPDDDASGEGFAWPAREHVRAYVSAAATRVREALAAEDLDRPGDPLLDRAAAAFAIVEHEEMHHETLQYIFHRLPLASKRRPAGYSLRTDVTTPRAARVRIPGGDVTLGAERDAIPFGWDNEFPSTRQPVTPFEIDAHDVTNGAFLEFVADRGYARESLWGADGWAWRSRRAVEHPLFWERHENRWFWRGMFDLVPLPESWPVYVTLAEADAFSRWRNGRLPTEAEYHRATFGEDSGRERPMPWGDRPADVSHGNFGCRSWDPVPVGSYPSGVSAFGVHDLVGNGWEWTSTPFRPFRGFAAMASYPEYSADFFDDKHFVLKGASPATALPLIRRSFRNWFRPTYPYVYATFHCVSD
jgi:iron(II)-dependent oxidoreductase